MRLVVLPICKWDWRASTKAETIPPLTAHRWSQLSRAASLPAAAHHSRADRIWKCHGDFAHHTRSSNSVSTSHTVSNIWGIMSLCLPQLLLLNPLTVFSCFPSLHSLLSHSSLLRLTPTVLILLWLVPSFLPYLLFHVSLKPLHLSLSFSLCLISDRAPVEDIHCYATGGSVAHSKAKRSHWWKRTNKTSELWQ